MSATDATPKRPAWADGFLASLQEGATVTEAARDQGIDRSTAYRLRQRDEAFALEWADVEEESTEKLEKEAFRRAVDGVAEPVFHQGKVVGAVAKKSDTLLIFLLKARRPEKYRERLDVKHGGQVDHKHRPDYSKLSAGELAELERITRSAE